MPDLRQVLEDAEALVARLKLKIATGSCEETGHIWKHLGGANAGCCRDCGCSAPVNVCEKCGDCDYGDNDEADRTRGECQRLYPDRSSEAA